MVRHERPSVEGGPGFQNQISESSEEIYSILGRAEDPPALDPACDDVMEGALIVEPWTAWHQGHDAFKCLFVKYHRMRSARLA